LEMSGPNAEVPLKASQAPKFGYRVRPFATP